MNEQGTSQNQEKADSEPQTGGGGAESDRGAGTAGTPWPGMGQGASDLTLLGKQIRKGGRELLLGWGAGPQAPPLGCQREGELSADAFLCSF